MSKNPKFSVKNIQIAEAINLKGLKAKLSKKPPQDEVASEEVKPQVEGEQIESAVHKKGKTALKAVKTKDKEEHVVEEAVVVRKEVSAQVIQKETPVVEKVVVEPLSAPIAEVKKVESAPTSAPFKEPPKPALRPPVRPPMHSHGQNQRQPQRYSHGNMSRGDQQRTTYHRPAQERTAHEGGVQDTSYGSHRPRPFQPHPQRSPGTRGSSYGPPGRTAGPGQQQRRFDDRKPFQQKPFGSSSQSGGQRPPPFNRGPVYKPFGGTTTPQVAPSHGAGKDGPTKEWSAERAGKFEARKGMEIDFKQGKKGKDQKRGEKGYDSRVRHGLVSIDDGEIRGRKKRGPKQIYSELEVARPTKIKVRLPILMKDLAAEMKLKASELVAKLFLQGIVMTLNDALDDETLVQLLGHDFGCEIVIDTSEKERLQITDKTVREEIIQEDKSLLVPKPPVVAFMGHVDHGKTTLIDAIRRSNRAAKEVGAITQHIGAFQCSTSHGPITILDTPGHEAFTLMRERGAEITDVVVLVVAGDEGMQEQTIEVLNQARKANATIVVAITKSDKPNFDADNVMRQLADHDLLPEAWGGKIVTVNCSAVTNEGVESLLEMIAIQAEVLELHANPTKRARGVVIESEVIQGLGDCATVLVQNGTLREGDALVFATTWAKIKSMRDEFGKVVKEAGPSRPVVINGMSGLPEAGEEFIVVKNEKEARDIAQQRHEGKRESSFMMKKRLSVEKMMQSQAQEKKILNIILRADVQGSLEALQKALEKIKSEKVAIEFISQGVGQISESDIQLASASRAIILGFHTALESHAEPLVKELKVDVRLHDIIYHAVDDIKLVMKGLLDKIPKEMERGKAHVKMCFKSSQHGVIAGCLVTEGVITRNCRARLIRGSDVIWTGSISSLKRVKEDVKEVQKGIECGILLAGFYEIQPDDVIEAFEITYLEQDL